MVDPLLAAEFLTPEEYLAGEERADVKHEFVGGRIYAFDGASLDHTRIASNLQGMLWQRLVGKPCEVVGSDRRLRAAVDAYYYPDLMVCCDPTDNDQRDACRPRLVVEITSPATQRIDLTEKAAAYWRVPSIETYRIVDQETLSVQILRRGGETWQVELLTQPEQRVRLESLGFEASLAQIYERTAVAQHG